MARATPISLLTRNVLFTWIMLTPLTALLCLTALVRPMPLMPLAMLMALIVVASITHVLTRC